MVKRCIECFSSKTRGYPSSFVFMRGIGILNTYPSQWPYVSISFPPKTSEIFFFWNRVKYRIHYCNKTRVAYSKDGLGNTIEATLLINSFNFPSLRGCRAFFQPTVMNQGANEFERELIAAGNVSVRGWPNFAALSTVWGLHTYIETGKRRKVRCIFRSGSHQVCTECVSRGTRCQSQQFVDDEIIPASARSVPDRLGRLEAMMETVLQHIASDQQILPRAGQSHEVRTPSPESSCVTDDPTALSLFENEVVSTIDRRLL